MLAGYPVDGSIFGQGVQPGIMYATAPLTNSLNLSTNDVYTASWFLSYPGNSGGPLYVQFTNGYYYPAAIYLGTLGTASAVRAINSDVVNLINLASSLGDAGTNYTGGGVLTIVPRQVSAGNPGYVQLQLRPPAAVKAGAAWRLVCANCDTNYSNATNYTLAVTTTNTLTIQFKPIPGWNLPTNQTVSVQPGIIAAPNAFYTVTNPILVASRELGLGITGTTGTIYRIETRTSLLNGSWVTNGTNTIISNGFNLLLPWPTNNSPGAFYRAVWLP